MTGRAAFVVDDLLPPWQPRGVEVCGQAEVFVDGGRNVNADFGAELIRFHPVRIVGWGLNTDIYRPNSRSVEGAAM
jgi:pyridoxamine 5'-phosphate oxidase family protein